MPKLINFFVRISTDVRSEYLTPDGTYHFSIAWAGSLKRTISALWYAVEESVQNLQYAEEKNIHIYNEHGRRLPIPFYLLTDDPGRYTNHGRVDADVIFDVMPTIYDRPALITMI